MEKLCPRSVLTTDAYHCNLTPLPPLGHANKDCRVPIEIEKGRPSPQLSPGQVDLQRGRSERSKQVPEVLEN